MKVFNVCLNLCLVTRILAKTVSPRGRYCCLWICSPPTENKCQTGNF